MLRLCFKFWNNIVIFFLMSNQSLLKFVFIQISKWAHHKNLSGKIEKWHLRCFFSFITNQFVLFFTWEMLPQPPFWFNLFYNKLSTKIELSLFGSNIMRFYSIFLSLRALSLDLWKVRALNLEHEPFQKFKSLNRLNQLSILKLSLNHSFFGMRQM